jgi:uracil-DNA glycosylase family 4
MDARELLRRYLEQRREMGESELVLDSLTVDEALRIVGAARGNDADSAPSADVRPRQAGDSAVDRAGMVDRADWRAVLRAAGAEPAASESSGRRARPAPPVENAVSMHRSVEPPAGPAAVPPSATTRSEQAADLPMGISVGSDARELFGGPFVHLETLEAVAQAVHDCRRCPLYSTATHGVPGEGASQADVIVVGEAPGANEDATGRPFVGAAGQLLTKILSAVNLRREEVFICNVMKHRPPGNRNPTPDEVAACKPYLTRQIELVRPKVILALGTFAAQTLLATKLSIGKLRGQVHRYHGVPLIVTYHPAALLRNPGWKRPTWEDVQLARRVLDRAASGA